ncbi:hypothetical protein K469DRAFT_555597 [Zopfia rhizophila CBS 207.26]|uniref:Protein LOT5 n=1 Tax=Zopfia rhizophila CBS 207.26 TaxID=1314779 RepID=A0A6A6EL85_9PEZI|nr:hypothetical protein K469DRAFT_555597 [Zopfia rhizophila CBS 207.26]
MALSHLNTAPVLTDFTPLEEHQTQTPSTFYGGKPVLYANFSGLTLAVPRTKLQNNPEIAKFSVVSSSDGTTTDGPVEEPEEALIKDVEIWVNSEDLVLFQQKPNPTGVSIQYPSIALHATMKWKSGVEALYMNLSLNDAQRVNDEDDIEILELTVLPPYYDTSPETACIKEIYHAMNSCADLHPDPDVSDDVEEEGEDDAPGAGGWITAENMHEFTDENGNITFPGGALGAGAGIVRPREDNGVNGANGVDGTDEETKWRRTE